MNQKAFTLIELLVVVAIIGILAAVGVVAYNGYTSAAKVSATKANHKSLVKFIKAELMKCELGDASIFKDGNYGAISCNDASSVSSGWSINEKGGMRLRDSLFNNSKIFNSKNLYNTSELAVQRQCSQVYGYCIGMIHITEFNTANSSAGGLRVTTCFKEPCNASSRNNHPTGLLDEINVYPN
jgi:prepilin-type N-terminal cleavage/methylation domain-containing protein